MNNLKSNSKLESSIPDFKLPKPYCDDTWPIKTWDYYKNSDKKSIDYWNSCGNTYTDFIDFTICNNVYIREEIKFYMYSLIESKHINLYTLASYWKELKVLIRYVNDYLGKYLSLTDLDSSDGLENFIKYKDKRKKQAVVKSGEKIYSSNMKKKNKTIKSTYIGILKKVTDVLEDFYDNRPIFEKDVWKIEKLPMNIDISKTGIRSLNFAPIKQPMLKKTIKNYIWKRFNTVSMSTIDSDLLSLRFFCTWLYEHYPEIEIFASINRPIIEEYIKYLRVEAGVSSPVLFKRLSCLATFLDFCRIFNVPDTPSLPILDSDDYSVKLQYEKAPYSDDEMRRIADSLKYLKNKQHARMIFCIMEIGCRINELCTLTPYSLIKRDGSYSLRIDASKNNNPYTIPISDIVGKVLEKAICVSRELYGNDVKYIFASSADKYITRCSLDTQMKKVCVEHNVLDDSGKIIHVTFHRFRTTKVSKYLQKGLDADIVSLLVGHKVKTTLKHYAKATNKELVESLQPLMDKYTALIDNAGNIAAMKNLSSDNIPLPNGRCNKAADTGICEHANYCLSCAMFVPQKEYLYMYKKELSEIEAAISIAKANNNQRLLEYNQQIKQQLESIIKKCEE